MRNFKNESYLGNIKILSKRDLLISFVVLLDDSKNFYVGGLISAVFHVTVNSGRIVAEEERERRGRTSIEQLTEADRQADRAAKARQICDSAGLLCVGRCH